MAAGGVIEPVPLFADRREWTLFLLVAALLFAAHLAWRYVGYRDFVSRPFYYTWGRVLQERIREGKHGSYRLLTVRSDGGMRFYTRSYRRESLEGRRIRLQLFPSEGPGFLRYLGTPYIPSRLREVGAKEDGPHRRLAEAIAAQHRDREAAAFYRGIFLADPLPTELRERIAALGASHLVALSGFHLSILWGAVFWLLRPLYRWGQRRWFLWRYDLLDLGALGLVLLAGYLWLTGAPPSLLRSYAMLLLGWAALLLGLEIVSFGFWVVTGVVLLVLFPGLAFSLGFWLSMAGVFAIFLLLKYFGHLPSRWVALGVIPVGIYALMLPLTHALFPVLSPWQHLSPLLSLGFVLFYPLAILLHLLGVGGWMDPLLQWLWHLPAGSVEFRSLPPWTLPLYIALALMAVRSRLAFAGMGGAVLGTLVWMGG